MTEANNKFSGREGQTTKPAYIVTCMDCMYCSKSGKKGEDGAPKWECRAHDTELSEGQKACRSFRSGLIGKGMYEYIIVYEKGSTPERTLNALEREVMCYAEDTEYIPIEGAKLQFVQGSDYGEEWIAYQTLARIHED